MNRPGAHLAGRHRPTARDAKTAGPAGDDRPPPRPSNDGELRFERKRPVQWFRPKVLATTGVHVAISAIVGDFLDKRELQQIAPPKPLRHGNQEEETWIDFVADTGDGFDATYSVAWLAAQRELEVEGLERPLPRSRLLVLGGDEVYPSASSEEYDNRFRGPYKASFPFTRDETHELLAIPGNHDWYDGLTNFMRLFCTTDERWIGGRRTPQTHSYFAVELPHNWWLWGIDIQFDAYIDDPQLRFFKQVAEGMKERGHIILCTGKPSWTDVEADPKAFRNLAYFQNEAVGPKADVLLSISGDTHHYARYENGDGGHKITAGGGGAFLHPTHHLDNPLNVPCDPHGDVKQPHLLKCRYPTERRSRLLSLGALALPWRSPHFLLGPAIIYLLLGWSTHFASRVGNRRFAGPLEESVPRLGPLDLLRGLFANPVSILLLLVVFGGLVGFAKPAPDWLHGPKKLLGKLLLGVPHFVLQVAVGVLVIGPLAIWLADWFEGPAFTVVLLVALLVLGAVLASLTMGAYLAFCCACLRAHGNEAFSAMALADYKNLLRLHIDGEGVLTVYPIGLDRCAKKWDFDPDNDDEEAPWLKPAAGEELRPRLIESPVRIDPRPADGRAAGQAPPPDG